MDCEVPNISPGIGIASTEHFENLLLAPFTIVFLQERIKETEKASPIHILFHR